MGENKLDNKIKCEVEKEIEKIIDAGISENNIDLLYSLVDIHKDVENEEYWDCKKEVLKMRYRDYDHRGYDERDYEDYGARRRDSRGRYMTGRGRMGHRMIDDMRDIYEDYSESKEEYNRGNYGAKEDTLKSLDYMLKSVVQFIEMLKEEATTDEARQLIKKYSREISEM